MNIASILTQSSSACSLLNNVQSSNGKDTSALQKFLTLLDAKVDETVAQSKPIALIQRAAEKKFTKADTDGNGSLSKDEFLNMLKGLEDRMLRHVKDVKGQSGKPSLEDVFTKVDADGDGAISKDEFTALLNEMRSRGSQRMSMVQNAGGMPSAEELFKQADTDGDGAVSKSEFSAMHDKMRSHGPHGGPAGGGPSGNVDASVASSLRQSSGQGNSSSTDPADTNGDGTVTMRERLAYILGQDTSGTLLQMLGKSTDFTA